MWAQGYISAIGVDGGKNAMSGNQNSSLYTNSKKSFIMIKSCASDGVGAPPLDTTSCFAYTFEEESL